MISIIMPTLNSEKTIGRVLDAMLRALQGYSFHLIVVDGGSTDKTLDIVMTRMGSRHYTLLFENRGSQALAVDMGIGVSNSGFVCFLDSDILVPVNFFTRLLSDFDFEGRIAAVDAKIASPSEEDGTSGLTVASSATRACLVVRRTALEGVYVDPRLKVAEDNNLTQQIMLKGKILHDLNVVCLHIRNFKVWGDMKRAAKYWYYQGLNFWLLSESPYKLTLKRMVPRSILFFIPGRKHLGFKLCERLGFILGLLKWGLHR